MKARFFTLIAATLLATMWSLKAQSPEGSTGWETLTPFEPKVLDENFQGFDFLHADQNPDQGNSDNLNPDSLGYKDDSTHFVIGTGTHDTIFYNYYQCAFAPEWVAAYAYRDTVDMPAGITPGFIEISREYESYLTVAGYFILDLRSLAFVEVIQYSHSSTGGNKRGFTLAKSTDDGMTWDTIRYQSGNTSTSLPVGNTFNCQQSAYGMRWEDGVWDFNVMLKFTDGNGQTVRLHDVKIYATPTTFVSTGDISDREVDISCVNRTIRLSEVSDIGIYSLNGLLLRRADGVSEYPAGDLNDGVYIVRARTDKQVTTRRVLIK